MKTLARTMSALAFFGGMAVLHADTPAQPAQTLSPTEMATKAANIRTQIALDNQKVLSLKEQAKKLKDVIKLNCVNDKQVQVKAEMNIADSASDALQGALAKGGGGDSQAAFQQLSSAANSVHGLSETAAACIGTPELFKQESGGTVDAPTIVDDPTVPPDDPFAGAEIEPPASASK